MSKAVNDVLAERKRQIEAEGWTLDHDDSHTDDNLALAAAWYALPEDCRHQFDVNDFGFWPWERMDYKPKGRRRDLVRAAALLIAEIERLDRKSPAPELLNQLAKDLGGTIEEAVELPDGSGFAVMSLPLPADHWLTQPGFSVPPMPFRRGANHPEREPWANAIREAGKYAIRASTMNGQEIDFDPDAMLQNLVVGMLGYWTDNGLSSDGWANPPQDEPPVA
jgi:hypothetical protein